MSEFNLSEKRKRLINNVEILKMFKNIKEDNDKIIFILGLVEEQDKEFIKRLKEEILGKQGILEKDYFEIIKEIDKLAGDKLK